MSFEHMWSRAIRATNVSETHIQQDKSCVYLFSAQTHKYTPESSVLQ